MCKHKHPVVDNEILVSSLNILLLWYLSIMRACVRRQDLVARSNTDYDRQIFLKFWLNLGLFFAFRETIFN